jgi:hypothetical protein
MDTAIAMFQHVLQPNGALYRKDDKTIGEMLKHLLVSLMDTFQNIEAIPKINLR